MIRELFADRFERGTDGAVFVDSHHGMIDCSERFDDTKPVGMVHDDLAFLHNLLGIVVHDHKDFVARSFSCLNHVQVSNVDRPEVAAHDDKSW